jgi:hypothetical protein
VAAGTVVRTPADAVTSRKRGTTTGGGVTSKRRRPGARRPSTVVEISYVPSPANQVAGVTVSSSRVSPRPGTSFSSAWNGTLTPPGPRMRNSTWLPALREEALPSTTRKPNRPPCGTEAGPVARRRASIGVVARGAPVPA